MLGKIGDFFGCIAALFAAPVVLWLIFRPSPDGTLPASLVLLALFLFGFFAVEVFGWRGAVVTGALVLAVFAGSLMWAAWPA